MLDNKYYKSKVLLFNAMAKRVFVVDWKSVSGATTRRRVLRLKGNADGVYFCPITACLHVGFKSSRGLRKHINNSHPWYYYFDEQPSIDRNDSCLQLETTLKGSTHKMPAFSLNTGTGKEFLDWLQTPCGGGKSLKESINIGRRAMKFLMASIGEAEGGSNVKEDYIDCCLGSPSIVINFLKLITEEWHLRSSGALTYLKAISDLLDFRKAMGIPDDTLRTFTVTEVYLRRGKENLAKKKKVEYSRNLDLETLISRNSWATIQEMEEVIPYHTPRYKYVLKKCKAKDEQVNVSELSFATRFIVAFMFLRVKCTRPMSYQFMTTNMFNAAKQNGGFIDQTLFKTHDKYMFDTLFLTDDVLAIIDTYVETIRPRLLPKCDYVLLTTNGTQYKALGTAMSLLVFQAIGKSINPTRYRQIVETESSIQLTTKERETMSKDQKHSSYVAKRSYQKHLSRQVAIEGRACMQKIVGEDREEHTRNLASSIHIDASTPLSDQPSCSYSVKDTTIQLHDVHENSEHTFEIVSDSDKEAVPIINTRCENDLVQPSNAIINTDTLNEHEEAPKTMYISSGVEDKENNKSPTSSPPVIEIPEQVDHCNDVIVPQLKDSSSNSTNVEQDTTVTTNLEELEVKKEELETGFGDGSRLKRFSVEEDDSLKKGIKKYGLGRWVQILRDKCLTFHSSRTRDSLRVRADTLGLSKKKTGKKKYNIRKQIV